MSPWAIILCEGAHDQAALTWLANICGGWLPVSGVPRSLPESIQATYPQPTPNQSGAYRFEYPPSYLQKDDRCIVVRQMGGIDRVLGDSALELLSQIAADGVGIVVDADDIGVTNRVNAFRDHYKQLFPAASKARAGVIFGSEPRVGLWVAPNNRHKGRMDDLLIAAAKRSSKSIVTRGHRFITSMKKVTPNAFADGHNKAVLGAVNQRISPGASLASTLNRNHCEFDPSLANESPHKELLAFVESLAR